MPAEKSQAIVVEPPFGGIVRSVPPRALAPRFAYDSENCWTVDGTLDVRDPWAIVAPLSQWASGISTTNLTILHLLRWRPGGLELLLVQLYSGLPQALRYVLLDDDGQQLDVLSFVGESTSATVRVLVEDRVYEFRQNGPNYVLSYESSALSRRNMGIVAPDTISAAATDHGTGGFPVGAVVWYRYTYYNSVADVESGASDHDYASRWDVTFNCNLTMPTSDDTQVDKVRVYRRIEDVDDVEFLLTTLDHTPGGADIVWKDDNTLTPGKAFDEQAPLGLEPPPPALAAAWHKGRLWVIPTDAPGHVRHGEFNKLEQFNPLNDYFCGGADGQEDLSLISVGAYLFILRSESLWAISGDGAESFVCDQIIPAPGLSAVTGATALGNRGLLWAGLNDVSLLDNRSVQSIGLELGLKWNEHIVYRSPWIVEAQTRAIAAFVFEHVVASDGRIFVRQMQNPAWAEFASELDGAAAFIVFDYDAGLLPIGLELVGFTASSHDLVVLRRLDDPAAEGRDFGTTAVAWFWETGHWDCGRSGLKRFNRAEIAWQTNGAAADEIKLGWRLNGTGSYTYVTGALDANGVLATTIGRVANSIQLRLAGSATKRTRITRIRLDYQLVGAGET